MDILYYSNFCKHSQKIIQFLSKGNLTGDLNFICIDKRTKDPRTNQLYIILENGKQVMLPPNIHNVPSLLLVNQNYRVISGEDIIKHFEPKIRKKIENLNENLGGEPAAFMFTPSSNNNNIVSEQYTYYNATPEELSTKGNGGNRQMYNYVRADTDLNRINTPTDSYKPDKVSGEVTIDKLQQQRNNDLPKLNADMFMSGGTLSGAPQNQALGNPYTMKYSSSSI
jgi:hypothetical protein